MSASAFSAKGSEAVGLFCATCITCVCIREISQKNVWIVHGIRIISCFAII